MTDETKSKSKPVHSTSGAAGTGGRTREGFEIEKFRGQLERALADYDNLRKRTEVEKEVWLKFAAQRVLIKLLPIFDMFEFALEHLKDQGLAIAVGEFRKALNEEGLAEITPKVGDKFDHEKHEVVESVNPPGGGGEQGTIADILLTGWRFTDGPVVRYAKVKVYGEPIEKKEEVVNN